MALILLFDSDHDHGHLVASALEKQRHMIVTFIKPQDMVSYLDRRMSGVDIVILDLSLNRSIDWQTLDHICHRNMTVPDQLGILCFSRIYRGPEFRLEVECRGARLFYDRSI